MSFFSFSMVIFSLGFIAHPVQIPWAFLLLAPLMTLMHTLRMYGRGVYLLTLRIPHLWRKKPSSPDSS